MTSTIPTCTWKRPIGQSWENPYVVRYPSNLDDGPEHGMPLGGFGAGCIGRSHNGQFNLWHIDGGEHTFQNFAGCHGYRGLTRMVEGASYAFLEQSR
jgi:non-lysosomal glucosylceramidase